MVFRSLALLLCFLAAPAWAQDEARLSFHEFIRKRARGLQQTVAPFKTPSDWEIRRIGLRTKLRDSLGIPLQMPCPLQPRKIGEIQREGYRIEKIIFQTLPGIWMTANAYVPTAASQVPAVLCVHGHWRGATQDPVVQSRCIGLVKLGFFVLVVDAFGAGERGIGRALGEYHGDMTAATLIPTGTLLAGIQVYENMRAVDYLQSRPEVDPDRIGVTGASGGGNQSMYVGALDERLKCVVPTCSVGNYQAFLGVACCMCETAPDALTYTELDGVLGMVAPRGLMVISATRDAVQFSVTEAKKSLVGAKKIYDLYNRSENVRHAIFEAGHDYNEAMREAMYGWMTLHLKGEGDGKPIAEPNIETLDPEALRCYPGDTRPDDWVTLPRFAAARARKLVAGIQWPESLGELKKQVASIMSKFRDRVLDLSGQSHTRAVYKRTPTEEGAMLEFLSEDDVWLRAEVQERKLDRSAILVDFGDSNESKEISKSLLDRGWTVVTVELRATGSMAPQKDRIGRAPDHNSAQWSLFTGQTLLGQWTWDLRQTIMALGSHRVSLIENILVVGVGPGGLVALSAAAVDPRIDAVVTVNALASFVSDVPYENQRLGMFVPGILRDVGDVAHLASLVASKPLIVAGGVRGGGEALDEQALRAAYRVTRRAYELYGVAERLVVTSEWESDALVERIAALIVP